MVVPDDHFTDMVEVFQIRATGVGMEVDDVLEEAEYEIVIMCQCANMLMCQLMKKFRNE